MIFIFLLLSTGAIAAPKPGKHKLPTETHSSSKQEKTDKCYFSEKQWTRLETQPRHTQSQVSTTCGGTHHKMSNFAEETETGHDFGTEHSLDLILCRGQGKCDIDWSKPESVKEWETRYICDDHLNELLYSWGKQQREDRTHKPVCNWPVFGHKVIVPTGKRYFVTKEDAHNLLKAEGRLIHPGSAVCLDHRKALRNIALRLAGKPVPGECTAGLTKDFDDDDDYLPYNIPKHPKETCPNPDLKTAFLNLVRLANLQRLDHYLDFEVWSEETKRKTASTIRKLIRIVVQMAAPDADDEFVKMAYGVIDDPVWGKRDVMGDYTKLMKNIARRYHSSQSSVEREHVLSFAAGVLPIHEIRLFVPGVTPYRYTRARRTARRGHVEAPVIKRERYDKKRVDAFIAFLASPLVLIGLPFGEKKVIKDDGSFAFIPNTLRQQRGVQIIAMYNKHLRSIGKFRELSMGDSTLYRIMHRAVATQRKATTCVDYFIAEGENAFDDTIELITEMKQNGFIDGFQFNSWKTMIQDGRHYLQTDYRLHVATDSTVADHCIRYALSGPNSMFSSTCKHQHNRVCARCDSIDLVFTEMDNTVKEKLKDATATDEEKELMEEGEVRIEINKERVMEMKKHQLRTVFASKQRSEIVESLEDGHGLLTIDYAMKFLPLRHRETQREWFGKKGISYHISHLFANVSGQLVQHSFVHIMGADKQDSVAVTQMLETVLTEASLAGIKGVHIRSDNAANYHCSSTIASIPHIAARAKLKVFDYSFSETQAGKSSSDRVAAEVKNHVRAYVNSNPLHKATTAEEFFTAATSEPMLHGISFYLCTAEKVATAVVPQIQNANVKYHFKYESNGIRTWMFHGIGEGELITGRLHENGGKLQCVKEGGALLDKSVSLDAPVLPQDDEETPYWGMYKCRKGKCEQKDQEMDEKNEENGHPEEIVEDEDFKPLYACPILNCKAEFLLLVNVEKHSDKGNHDLVLERESMDDHIVGEWICVLEQGKEAKAQCVKRIVDKMQKSRKAPKPNFMVGWAIKHRKPMVRLTDDQIAFLTEIYEKGNMDANLRQSPEEVEKTMRTELVMGKKRFPPRQRLTARQIASYFSRLAAAKAKMKKKTTTTPATVAPRGRGRPAQTRSRAERFAADPTETNNAARDKRETEEEDDLNWIDVDPDKWLVLTADTLTTEDVIEMEIEDHKDKEFEK